MNRSHPVSAMGRQVPFLVCETGSRWVHACRRFIGPFQHAAFAGQSSAAAEDEICFAVQPIEYSRIRALIAGLKDFALLWECTPENASAVALTIAQIGVARPDGLQLAAVQGVSRSQTQELSLHLMNLGISAAIDAPEQLTIISRHAKRHFSRP